MFCLNGNTAAGKRVDRETTQHSGEARVITANVFAKQGRFRGNGVPKRGGDFDKWSYAASGRDAAMKVSQAR
jgi:hypothetical protein